MPLLIPIAYGGAALLGGLGLFAAGKGVDGVGEGIKDTANGVVTVAIVAAGIYYLASKKGLIK